MVASKIITKLQLLLDILEQKSYNMTISHLNNSPCR